MEIERKFLIDYLPLGIDKFDKIEIEQGYITYEPEIEIKNANNNYYFIQNSIGYLKKEVKKNTINEESYNLLINCIQNNIVRKTRYLVPLTAKLTAEIDVFKDNLCDIKTVRVQFETIEQANEFIIPNWFGKEITYDDMYRNANLSKIDINQKRKKLV